MKENLRRHNFFIEPDAVTALKTLASSKGVSMAELVRDAIQQLLKREKRASAKAAQPVTE